MKKIIILIFLLVIEATAAAAKTPWESYLTLPIPERASMVNEIEYSPGENPENSGDLAAGLSLLRNQILACDGASFRLAYRLAENSDGGLHDGLLVILGSTIRAHPEFFLKEMAKLNPGQAFLQSILMALGPEYADRNYARRYELYMRRMALTDVSTSLNAFRDACLALIEID